MCASLLLYVVYISIQDFQCFYNKCGGSGLFVTELFLIVADRHFSQASVVLDLVQMQTLCLFLAKKKEVF